MDQRSLSVEQRVAEEIHTLFHGEDPADDYWCGWYVSDWESRDPVRGAMLIKAQNVLNTTAVNNDEEKAKEVIKALHSQTN